MLAEREHSPAAPDAMRRVMSTELSALDLSAPIEPRPPGCTVPLTAVQNRLFHDFVARWKAPLSSRMCASALRIRGALNLNDTETSIQLVVRRHEALRTRFEIVEGKPTQHVEPAGRPELTIDDLSGLQQPDAEIRAAALVQLSLDEKIDLTNGRLFEARAWKLAAEDHVLLLLADHLISDGMSNSILTREIWTAYREIQEKRPLSLFALPLQFPDYALWQHRTYGAWLREHRPYWDKRLGAATVNEIPTKGKQSDGPPCSGATVHIPFGNPLTARLREVALKESVLLPVIVLTAYALVMSTWCGQQDLLVPFVAHGRHGRPELENMIGYLSHLLLLRIEIVPNDSLRDVLLRTRDELAAALIHHDYDRVPDLFPNCATDLHFQWRSSRRGARSFRSSPETVKSLRTQPFFVRNPTDGPWNFRCLFHDTAAGIFATVHYRPHLIAPETVDWFKTSLLDIAKSVCERPGLKVGATVVKRP